MFSKWFINILSRSLETKPLRSKTAVNQQKHVINNSMSATLEDLRTRLGGSYDFIVRDLRIAHHPSVICYMEGLIDHQLLSGVLEALVTSVSPDYSYPDIQKFLRTKITAGNTAIVSDIESLLLALLDGEAIILTEGAKQALSVSLAGGDKRSVEEPSGQTVIRGPKEGFTEDISTNVSLVRRRIRTSQLRLNLFRIGRLTKTKVVVAYIEGIVDPEVVAEIRDRLNSIDTDSILESGYIEEFIQDAHVTPFPTIINTERPDSVAGGLLEGQVAIIVDGTPFVLLAPVTFIKFFQSSEDYYQRYDISTFLRIIRLIAFFIAMLLPSLYIAVTTFQQEMLPTTLLISLAAQREGTPFPALIEAILMELTFEVIREAGVRMPRVIGPAISIVGALVLGQAAVQAGLVSGAMVIVVSFTAISNFVIPAFSMGAAVRLIRFVLMILAGTLGLFGVLVGLIPIIVHLISLRSFGVPYLMPFSPLIISNLKDYIVRFPWWAMRTRPKGIGSSENRQRQSNTGWKNE